MALALGWAGAVLWAYSLVVLEPLTPTVRDDSYWARDLRWGAVLAVAASFLWLSRGRHPYAWFAPVALVVWLGADLGLDRLDLGRGALAPVALAGVAVVALADAVLVRSQGDRGQRPLIAAAAVCAVVAPLCLPSGAADGSPGVRTGIAALLVVVALTCALSASPASFRMRIAAITVTVLWLAGAAAGLFTGALLLVAGAVLLVYVHG